MNAHRMAGDLGYIFIREGDFVAPVAGTDQVSEIFRLIEIRNLGNDFLHGELGGFPGDDFTFQCGVGNHLSVLVQNDCLGVCRAYVTAAEIFHNSSILLNILMLMS